MTHFKPINLRLCLLLSTAIHFHFLIQNLYNFVNSTGNYWRNSNTPNSIHSTLNFTYEIDYKNHEQYFYGYCTFHEYAHPLLFMACKTINHLHEERQKNGIKL